MSDRSDDDLVAIVIGAGPSGLACSLGLSTACRKVILIEKHPSFDRRGSTFGMARNGQKALSELRPGLLEDMQSIGLPAGKEGSGATLVFVWWEMRDVLLRHVRQTHNIDLICGHEFQDICDDDEGGVTVTFAGRSEIKGDFLVAADGVHSSVRNVLNLPPLLESDTTNFRGSLVVPETASAELKTLLDKGMVPFFAGEGKNLYFVLFNFNERHPGRLTWVLATRLDVQGNDKITPFTIAEEHAKTDEEKKLLREILSLSEKKHLEPYPRSSIVDLSDSSLSSLGGGWGGKGRITLVGDAAHGMRPTDGYGGSMALEDAVVLTRMLKSHMQSNNGKSSLSNILRRFESDSLPRVKRVYDNQFDRYETRMREGRRPGPQDDDFITWLHEGV